MIRFKHGHDPDSKFNMAQLTAGILIEREHNDTINFIKKAIREQKEIKNKKIFMKIAQDHLKEDPYYYTKLKKASL